jgi:hypothetical protein
MFQAIFESIQLALRDYRRRGVRRSLEQFRESAFALLCSRIGRMAMQAAQEVDDADLSHEERRHLATARLFSTISDAGLEAEDWIVKALVELALRELELPTPPSAMECFYP